MKLTPFVALATATLATSDEKLCHEVRTKLSRHQKRALEALRSRKALNLREAHLLHTLIVGEE